MIENLFRSNLKRFVMTTIMTKRRAKSDSIPIDLIPEILSRLPAKSVFRFRCVSKLWESIICRQDFAELFYTMSSSKPRLLIGAEQGQGVWSFFSSPQPQNHYGKSSLVLAADFHSKFSEDRSPYCLSYASGLFYFTKVYDYHVVRKIFNPSTGQQAILPPDPRAWSRKRCWLRATNRYPSGYPCGVLGFDPIGKQFKVLVLRERVHDGLVYQILTLGTEKLRWREIKCPSIYGPNSHGICINGVLYYKAYDFDQEYKKIGYFDVRSETFKFLNVDPDMIGRFRYLLNYNGKLCVCKLKYGHNGGFPLKLRMWVLEDVEKGEWSSTYAYTVSAEDKVGKVYYDLSVVGATALGEIVLAKEHTHKPFYVFYFNPDKNTLLSVEIQGLTEEAEWFNYHRLKYVVDHVEDLNFDLMKIIYAATSIRPPEQSTTSTSSTEDHQVRTFPHLEQDRSYV